MAWGFHIPNDYVYDEFSDSEKQMKVVKLNHVPFRSRKPFIGLILNAVLAVIILASTFSHAQIRFAYDNSGNPTNLVSGTAAPTVTAPSGTQAIVAGAKLSLSAVAKGS